MSEKLPELAISNDFSSRALEPDKNGIYTVVEYRRKDGTLYMRSSLSNEVGKGRYGAVTLSYFDEAGITKLHDVKWELGYDINRKIVSKRVD